MLTLAAWPLALGACAPKAPPTPPVQMDCNQSFDELKAKVLAQPGLDAKPKDPNEPYRAYTLDDGRIAYMVTEPGAPAHPAILMQEAAGGAQKNSGCGFGDKRAYQELANYLTGLKAALHGS